MKKLSIKDLIDFKNKSDKAKKTFAENMKSNKIEVPSDGGGDYWITSLSAISNSYRKDDIKFANDKIVELNDKFSNSKHTISKNMYQRNVSVLENYKTLDFEKLRPKEEITFLKNVNQNRILNIKGFQVEAKPSLIFTFGKKGEEKIGSIYFTAKVNGYKIEEVGMFCDMQYRFLKHYFSKTYELMPNYCIALDMISGNKVDYSNIKNGTFIAILNSTLDELNKLL